MPGYSGAAETVVPTMLLLVEEAADTLRISRTAVYGLISSGELASIKIGGRRRVPRASIEDYVARQLAAAFPDSREAAPGGCP